MKNKDLVWERKSRIKPSLPQLKCVHSWRCLLIFPVYMVCCCWFFVFITLLEPGECMQVFVRDGVLVVGSTVAPRLTHRVWCTVGKQEAFVFFHGLQHSFAALSILPSISPTHLAPSPYQHSDVWERDTTRSVHLLDARCHLPHRNSFPQKLGGETGPSQKLKTYTLSSRSSALTTVVSHFMLVSLVWWRCQDQWVARE